MERYGNIQILIYCEVIIIHGIPIFVYFVDSIKPRYDNIQFPIYSEQGFIYYINPCSEVIIIRGVPISVYFVISIRYVNNWNLQSWIM